MDPSKCSRLVVGSLSCKAWKHRSRDFRPPSFFTFSSNINGAISPKSKSRIRHETRRGV